MSRGMNESGRGSGCGSEVQRERGRERDIEGRGESIYIYICLSYYDVSVYKESNRESTFVSRCNAWVYES